MTLDTRTIAQIHQEWARGLRAATGKSPSRIADDIGIGRTTITRKIKAEHPTETFNAATIEKIVNCYGIPGPGGYPLPVAPARGVAEDAIPYAGRGADDPTEQALIALIGERNGLVPWTLKTHTLERLGYLPGDIVLVDLNAHPEAGQPVCAQVYDWAKMKAETVMRLYQRAGGIELLLACPNDPNYLDPLLVDGARVIIKGVLLPHRLRPSA